MASVYNYYDYYCLSAGANFKDNSLIATILHQDKRGNNQNKIRVIPLKKHKVDRIVGQEQLTIIGEEWSIKRHTHVLWKMRTFFVDHERMAGLTVNFDSWMIWVTHRAKGYLNPLLD